MNDLWNPRGANDLSARAKFFQRSLYKEAIYPPADEVPRPLDTWYDKNLYGRVDRCQNTIIPNIDNLKQIRYAVNPGIYCLDFVEEAFTAFVKHMRELTLMGVVDKRGNKDIWNPTAVLGYTDPTAKWKTFIDGVIDSFTEAHVDSGADVIKTYADFVPLFRDYLTYVAGTYAITKENFLLSNVVSPFISGLNISISRLPAGRDEGKFRKFIMDPNFECYVAAAKKHGFIVNKNMPWILTADLFTEALQYFLEEDRMVAQLASMSYEFEIDENNFFPFHYFKTYRGAFVDLQYVFARGYTRFVSKRPLYADQKVIFNKNCGPKINYPLDPYGNDHPDAPEARPMTATTYYRENSVRRQVLSFEECRARLDDLFLLDLYVQLRHTESRESYKSVDNIYHRAREVFRNPPNSIFSPRHNALEYINEVYRSYIYPANHLVLNPNLDVAKLEETDIIDTGVEVARAPLCELTFGACAGFPFALFMDAVADENGFYMSTSSPFSPTLSDAEKQQLLVSRGSAGSKLLSQKSQEQRIAALSGDRGPARSQSFSRAFALNSTSVSEASTRRGPTLTATPRGCGKVISERRLIEYLPAHASKEANAYLKAQPSKATSLSSIKKQQEKAQIKADVKMKEQQNLAQKKIKEEPSLAARKQAEKLQHLTVNTKQTMTGTVVVDVSKATISKATLQGAPSPNNASSRDGQKLASGGMGSKAQADVAHQKYVSSVEKTDAGGLRLARADAEWRKEWDIATSARK